MIRAGCMLHRRLALAASLGVLCTPGAACAMDVALTGSWTVSLGASDLASGPGSPFTSTQASASSEIRIDVTLTAGNTDNWRLDVRKADTTWDPSIHVWVRRTGTGSGAGSVADGLSWVEVTSTDTEFYSGAGDRTGIPVQVRITGISLSVPPASYYANLTYSLVDTL
jgi:hypothetical protein